MLFFVPNASNKFSSKGFQSINGDFNATPETLDKTYEIRYQRFFLENSFLRRKRHSKKQFSTFKMSKTFLDFFLSTLEGKVK